MSDKIITVGLTAKELDHIIDQLWAKENELIMKLNLKPKTEWDEKKNERINGRALFMQKYIAKLEKALAKGKE